MQQETIVRKLIDLQTIQLKVVCEVKQISETSQWRRVDMIIKGKYMGLATINLSEDETLKQVKYWEKIHVANHD